MPNRLATSSSPYLLQHADNPVDWWPWCQEAFEEARRRDVPVLLSVGYAACHWCHVMAHESFEDSETGALMNDNFVNIKVDREERPDVDAIYMAATQSMTGHGGWPMTCFLTPEGEPFYCAMYFPQDQFRRVLHAVTRAWRQERWALVDQGRRIVDRLVERAPRGGRRTPPDAAVLDAAVTLLREEFDARYGGFGDAPKFPPSMVLEFLLRHHARTGEGLDMVERTCAAMVRGGIYDQLGGGFARYSVDARWAVPHFEKMLYDNALLLRVYLHWWRATGSPLARRVTVEIAEWLVRELRTPEGGFASSVDADSDGEEGRYYLWTPAELRAVLGAADGAWAARVFGVSEAGTAQGGRSVLQLTEDLDDADWFQRMRAALSAARSARARPGRDDKVVAAWNGLAITALAEAGTLLDRRHLIGIAEAAADLITRVHLRDGRILRTSRRGVAGPNVGVLEDYSDLAEGFLTLYEITGAASWLRHAEMMLNAVLDRFPDGEGGFYDTPDDGEPLFQRPRQRTETAAPCGQFAAAGALLSYAALTGSGRHREADEAALGEASVAAGRFPRYVGWGLATAEALIAGPVQVAVVGPPEDPRTRDLHRVALLSPSTVTAVGDPAAPPSAALLRDRTMIRGRPTAYVCRGFVCELPTTDPYELCGQLAVDPALLGGTDQNLA
jgi:uncharacterized protein YyaL (SSP411 family)